MNVPIVKKITIYPVKSLDGISLQKALVTTGGCLLHDREYAIADLDGNFINGKNNPRVHTLRTNFDLEKNIISFREEGKINWQDFHLQDDRDAIQDYLSAHFDMPAIFLQNKTGRFLDIPDKSGITVLSTASLKAVSGWFNNIDLEETRKRFRATVEIEAPVPFWEDHLFSDQGTAIEFMIGDIKVYGISPRARCVVPTRHPVSGEVIHAFPKTFARHRAETLPQWSALEEYNHYYYLSVDCHIPSTEVGKWIGVNDEVKIIGERKINT